MNFRQKISLLACLVLFSVCKGQDTLSVKTSSDIVGNGLSKTPQYARPKPFAFVANVPSDLWQMAKTPFKKENLKMDAIVVGSTALLIIFDQKITDNVNSILHKANITSSLEYGDGFSLHSGSTNVKIVKVPKTAGAFFYSMGEGWVGVAIGAGFWVQGMITHNNRSRQTASDLLEGFITSGLSSQIIKRTTGRESPFVATKPAGAWRPFPSFSEYQNNTEHYDAFPSGHLTTMMTTVSILAENYPEYKWIRPVGYALVSLTGLAMVHGKVHWAGDYPLAMAMGYVNGKIITGRHKQKRKWAL
jgi:membrane-associated phospholipid phosphatase